MPLYWLVAAIMLMIYIKMVSFTMTRTRGELKWSLSCLNRGLLCRLLLHAGAGQAKGLYLVLSAIASLILCLNSMQYVCLDHLRHFMPRGSLQSVTSSGMPCTASGCICIG